MAPIRDFTRNNIKDLNPYIPGFQPEDKGIIKLNANENPYPPSPGVLEALRENIGADLRLYPNSRSMNLRRQLAATYDLEEAQVFAANGSDEIISLIFRTFAEANDIVASPFPTYTFYQTAAQIHGIKYLSIETDADFRVNLEEFLDNRIKIAFIANPNAHTGILVDTVDFDRFLCSYQGLLVIDEAYIDFSGPQHSAYPLVNKHDNLIILRTFSKSFSLCGIRVGYAFADPRLIEALDKTRDSYNIAYLNQVAAAQALKDYAYMQANARKIIESRTWFNSFLISLGFVVFPSAGNYLLIRHPAIKARDIYIALQDRNILVRFFDIPRLDNFIRISIGTDRQLKEVASALHDILIGSSIFQGGD